MTSRVALLAAVVIVSLVIAGLAGQSAASQLVLRVGDVNPTLLLLALPCAAWSFGLRAVRWHLLVSRLAPKAPFSLSLYTQVIGAAFAPTPGRVAELYKLRPLERATGLEPTRALPAVLAERLIDTAAFGVLILVGGALTWAGWDQLDARLLLTSGFGVFAIGLAVQARDRVDKESKRAPSRAGVWGLMVRSASRLPMGDRFVPLLEQIRDGALNVASPPVLVLGLVLVVIGRIGDALVIWYVAQAMGFHVPLAAAAFAMGSAGLAGGISLSPGGIGAAEATLVALLTAQQIPFAPAVTIALASRMSFFWIWVALGWLVLAAGSVPRLMGRVRRAMLPATIGSINTSRLDEEGMPARSRRRTPAPRRR